MKKETIAHYTLHGDIEEIKELERLLEKLPLEIVPSDNVRVDVLYTHHKDIGRRIVQFIPRRRPKEGVWNYIKPERAVNSREIRFLESGGNCLTLEWKDCEIIIYYGLKNKREMPSLS